MNKKNCEPEPIEETTYGILYDINENKPIKYKNNRFIYLLLNYSNFEQDERLRQLLA